MGRPKAVIDYELTEKLSLLQCTQDEIAEVLGVSARTLQRDEEFCRLHKKGLEQGKSSLRRLQWDKAKDGNVTMLIWLGKQYLGQKDKHEGSLNGSLGIQIIDNIPRASGNTDAKG